MTKKELEDLLKQSGYDVAHVEFSRSPSVPYISYQIPSEDSHGGDTNSNSVKNQEFRVELYTEYDDEIAQGVVDDLLSETAFHKTSTKIESEKLYLTIYEFEITSKIRR